MSAEDLGYAITRRARGQQRPTPDIAEPPPNWTVGAVCTSVDFDMFYPEKGGSTMAAKRVCQGCPVRPECLQQALDRDERFGVWGGLSERERRRIAGPGIGAGHRRVLAGHGTPAAARRHYREGTKPYDACLEANSVAKALRNERRKATA